jgi:N-methylhydantoinase A
LNSDLTADFVKTALMPLSEHSYVRLNAVRRDLRQMVENWFDYEKVAPTDRRLQWIVEMRYVGQNYELALTLGDEDQGAEDCKDLARTFHATHERMYGFSTESEAVEFVNMKIKAVGVLDKPPLPILAAGAAAEAVARRRTLFAAGDWYDTPVFRRDSLAPGQALAGPAVIEQMDTTSLIFPGDHCVVDDQGNMIVTLDQGNGSCL